MTNPTSKDVQATLARIDWELQARTPDWLVDWENDCLKPGGEAWQAYELGGEIQFSINDLVAADDPPFG